MYLLIFAIFYLYFYTFALFMDSLEFFMIYTVMRLQIKISSANIVAINKPNNRERKWKVRFTVRQREEKVFSAFKKRPAVTKNHYVRKKVSKSDRWKLCK